MIETYNPLIDPTDSLFPVPYDFNRIFSILCDHFLNLDKDFIRNKIEDSTKVTITNREFSDNAAGKRSISRYKEFTNSHLDFSYFQLQKNIIKGEVSVFKGISDDEKIEILLPELVEYFLLIQKKHFHISIVEKIFHSSSSLQIKRTVAKQLIKKYSETSKSFESDKFFVKYPSLNVLNEQFQSHFEDCISMLNHFYIIPKQNEYILTTNNKYKIDFEKLNHGLKKLRIIDKYTKNVSLERALNGETEPPKKPVKLVGNKNKLTYFLQVLHEKKILHSTKYWDSVSQAFVYSSGLQLTLRKLSKKDLPSKSIQTLIDKLIESSIES